MAKDRYNECVVCSQLWTNKDTACARFLYGEDGDLPDRTNNQ